MSKIIHRYLPREFSEFLVCYLGSNSPVKTLELDLWQQVCPKQVVATSVCGVPASVVLTATTGANVQEHPRDDAALLDFSSLLSRTGRGRSCRNS